VYVSVSEYLGSLGAYFLTTMYSKCAIYEYMYIAQQTGVLRVYVLIDTFVPYAWFAVD